MLGKLAKALLGDRQKKNINQLFPFVGRINEEFKKLDILTDDQLRDKTNEFRRRLAEGETLDDLMAEAFAVVKETCRRLLGKFWKVTEHDNEWNMVPFDVQLMGAVALHQGRITEMATGEGKTLAAVMPMYLNALDLNVEWIQKAKEHWGENPEKWVFEMLDGIPVGAGAHLITVNDYLASRDSQWMGEIYRFLGLEVGCIQTGIPPDQRKKQYNCDVTYGTNNEFGFDYLRDNMAVRLENRVQRGHHYAIIDEVDSVLIDEARTPLIISGPVAKSKNRYKEYRNIVSKLISRQTVLIGDIVARADTLWKEDSTYEAAELYLKAKRGAPKHRRLTKALQDPEKLKAIKKVEADRMRDKNLHLLDEDLLFSIDERDRSVAISDRGREILSPDDPDFFLLVDIGEQIAELENMNLDTVEKEKRKRQIYEDHSKKAEALHNIDQLLKAFQIFDKDVEYVIDKDRVVIVDQFTGRLMPGRRFSDGLHEALEAKENVEIRSETQTMASITIQNYFRMYETLAGMTGTAETEAEEFEETYGLDVVVIPTNVPVQRKDNNDRVYKTKREKYSAIINQIESHHRRHQPVLVGTVSVEVSEMISKMLKGRKVPHSVLNAKHHQKEAEIITRAGQPGVVTIATNMAGRGTDIKLAEAVLEITDESGEKTPGGLFVLGTERHEARRIDRQLRGRSGRQGDPGSSWFYLSLEDDLFRLFASERVIEFLKNSGDEGETIEHPMLTKAISRAQKRVEQYNYDIRKRLLEYDDVVNKQREIIYDLRLKALTGEGLQDEVLEMIGAVANYVIEETFPDSSEPEDWDVPRAQFVLSELAGAPINLKGIDDGVKEADELREKVAERVIAFYREKEEKLGAPLLRELEKWAMLRAIDSKWRDHLYDMDQLRGGIGLRSYGQRDPLVEYKKESFGMFETLLDDIDKLSVRQVLGLWPQPKGLQRSEVAAGRAYHPSLAGPGKRPAVRTAGQTGGQKQETVRKKEPGVGRNDPCPCGSGKKYKKCCGV